MTMMSRQLVEARIRIAASPDDVYQALTDEAALRAWFAEDASVDIGQGRYEFSGRFTPGTPQGGTATIKLLRAEPGRELNYSWPIHGDDTVVAMTLEAGDGGADLTLEHRGLGKDSAWIFECFWSTALENLRSYAERGVVGLRFDYANVPQGDIDLTAGIDAPPDTVFETLIDPGQLDR